MTRALPGLKRGKAWGNALGGFKTQKRDVSGRFAGGTATTRTKKAAKATAKNVTSPQPQRKKSKLSKDDSSSLRRSQNRSQERFKNGTLSRQAGAIPYTRHSYSSQSAGINAGFRVLPNYRLSGGAYLKIQNIDKTRREKELRNRDEKIILGTAEKLSPHPGLDGITAKLIKKVRRKSIDKLIGGEAKVGEKSYARLTTDQNAMPTLTVEYNRSAARTRRRTRGRSARRNAQWSYNDMVLKTRSAGNHVKQPRAQRRGN